MQNIGVKTMQIEIQILNMKDPLPLILIFSINIIASCNAVNSHVTQTTDSAILKENELLKRELSIKQKELDLEVNKKEQNPIIKDDVPISELYKNVKQGVFLVYTYDNNSISQGSGFFINNDGIAISNFHVFKNYHNGVVVLDNGQEFMITKIITSNEDQDYVIFKVGIDNSDFYPLPISSVSPDIGEPCFAIGNPEGLTQTLSIGNISGYRNINNQSYIQTTAEITHGSSGGPLFNKHGEVIGITTMGRSEANLNFAISINKIPYSDYNNISNPEINRSNIIPTENIKKILANYYNSLSNKEYTNLSNFYTPVLDRYYTEFGITSDAAVRNSITYWDKFKIISSQYTINWSTFGIKSLSDGCYSVTFNMDYFIERTQINKPKKFNLDINILFNPDLKIKSIYENIISSNK